MHWGVLYCTEMHYNVLKCTALHWNAMQWNVLHWNALQCNEMYWNAMQSNVIQCIALKWTEMQCNATLWWCPQDCSISEYAHCNAPLSWSLYSPTIWLQGHALTSALLFPHILVVSHTYISDYMQCSILLWGSVLNCQLYDCMSAMVCHRTAVNDCTSVTQYIAVHFPSLMICSADFGP